MGKRMVLFIDGPLRGRLAECDRPPLYMPQEPPSGWPGHSEPLSYYFHQVELFGHVLLVGSVGADSVSARNSAAKDDLWDLLVSSAAKQAERRL